MTTDELKAEIASLKEKATHLEKVAASMDNNDEKDDRGWEQLTPRELAAQLGRRY